MHDIDAFLLNLIKKNYSNALKYLRKVFQMFIFSSLPAALAPQQIRLEVTFYEKKFRSDDSESIPSCPATLHGPYPSIYVRVSSDFLFHLYIQFLYNFASHIILQ